MAPEIPKSGPLSRLTTAEAEWASPLRWEKGFRLTKTMRVIGRSSRKAETGDGKNVLYFRLLAENGLDLMANAGRVLKRGAGRRLLGDHHVAFIFGGNKSLGTALKTLYVKRRENQKYEQRDIFTSKQMMQRCAVEIGHRRGSGD